MAGCFEINKTKNGQFRFTLKATNGEIILNSELYKAKNSAQKGIASIQKHAQNDACFEEKTAQNGQFYFNLKSMNHQVIGTSEMYATEAARKNGIASVKKNATTATIKDNSIQSKTK